MMNKKVILSIFSSLCFGFLGAFFFNKWDKKKQETLSTENAIFAKPVGYNSQDVGSLNFVKASEVATPCVVFIKTTSLVEQRSGLGWFFDFDPFGSIGEVSSTGSGVIMSKDGYIVTNNHVIKGAKTIEVVLNNNKRTFEAKLIGADPSSDLALIKIEADNLPAIQFANSETLKIGEWVVAVGNPFNLTSTVTAGIVSAKGRNINIVSEQFPVESFIQTDAAINPGNSGGALVDLNGNLVGINTAIASKTGSYVGYGFAIPSKIVAKIIKDLKEFGQTQRALDGLEIEDIDSKTAENYKNVSGVLVQNVTDACPDALKHIKIGDIIQKINGVNIENKPNYDEQMAYYRPGDIVKLSILRDQKNLEFEIELVNENGTTKAFKKELFSSSFLNCDFEHINKLEKSKYKIEKGIKVVNVKSGRASQMGLTDGTILLSVNGKSESDINDFIKLLEQAKGKVTIEVLTEEGMRGYQTFYVR